MSHRMMSWLFWGLFLFLFSPVSVFGQQKRLVIASHEYGLFAGQWCTIVDGNKGDWADTGHIVVRLKSRGNMSQFDYASAGVPRLRIKRGKLAGDYYELEVPNGSNSFDIASRLDQTGYFDYLSFNLFYRCLSNPNDAYYPNQWAPSKIGANSAWNVSTGASSVIVAILDVGCDYAHEDLAANKWSGTGYDCLDNDGDPYPADGSPHGTLVAGICGGATNNSIGVAGIAGGWNGSNGIKLMHMRVGTGYVMDLSAAVDAIDLAAQWGAKVVNMSFGGKTPFDPLDSAIARHNGIVFVAASGNYSTPSDALVDYPAAYSGVIAVGATTESDTRKRLNDGTDEPNWGSCYGPQLDLVAPGIHMYSTDITGTGGYDPGNYYARFNGTSAASPLVAGVCALILSVNPTLTPNDVLGTLILTADKVTGMGGNNYTEEYGYGRVNAYNALKYTLEHSGGTIVGTLLVPQGETWTFSPGITLLFSPAARMLIYGSIQINGTASTHAVLDGQGYARSGYSNAMIVIAPGGAAWIQYADFGNAAYGVTLYTNSGNSTVRNCTFTNFSYSSDAKAIAVTSPAGPVAISNNVISGSNSQGTGVYVYNSGTGVRVDSNTVNYAGIGIRCYSSNSFLKRNTIHGNAYYGIQCDNVGNDAQYDGNDVRSSSYGIWLNSSSPWIMRTTAIQNGLNVLVNGGAPNFATVGGNLRGYNTIAYAGSPLLRAQNYGLAYLGYVSQGGYNSLFETDMPHVIASNNSGVWADNNYWGEGPSYSADGTSWVTASSPLGYNPNPDPLGKVVASSHAGGGVGGPSQMGALPADTTQDAAFRSAVSAAFDGDIVGAKLRLEDLIGGQSEKYSPLALLIYYDLCKGRWGIPQGLANIEASLYALLGNLKAQPVSQFLRPFALRLLARDAAVSRNDSAANTYRTLLLTDYPHSAHELATLYDFIVYYVHAEQNAEKANETLARMIALYPDDLLTYNAKVEVGEKMDLWALTKRSPQEPTERPTGAVLTEAYPNPFNPSTTIRYGVPQPSHATLAVYNILGQQVVELVNGEVDGGYHDVRFNASNLPSGVYFFRLQVGSYVETKKLLILR